MNAVTNPPAISEQLLARFDVPGPRYTSYPTADRFVEAYTAAQYQEALRQRASGMGG
ncbi:MAG TPA: coproporphyrinogen III oxidase, partial [Methylibium sp.]